MHNIFKTYYVIRFWNEHIEKRWKTKVGDIWKGNYRKMNGPLFYWQSNQWLEKITWLQTPNVVSNTWYS